MPDKPQTTDWRDDVIAKMRKALNTFMKVEHSPYWGKLRDDCLEKEAYKLAREALLLCDVDGCGAEAHIHLGWSRKCLLHAKEEAEKEEYPDHGRCIHTGEMNP